MVFNLIRSWGEWNWIILGLILMLLEIAAPGASLIWIGISALLVGAVALQTDIPWQAQVLLFAVLTMICVYVLRRVLLMREARGDPLRLNNRTRRLHGHVYPLVEDIANGVGRIRVDDTTWGVAGPDLPAGTLVRVTGHDGTLLTVVPFEG
jgi:hypothetical protein